MGTSSHPPKITTRLANVWTTSRWLERQRKLGLMWKSLRKDVDLEYPTTWLDQVFVGCTQRETEVHQHAVQAKADLFGRITTTQVTSEERTEVTISSQSITAWSHDMQGHTEKCVDKNCELAGKSVSASEPTEKQCMDGHQVSQNMSQYRGAGTN